MTTDVGDHVPLELKGRGPHRRARLKQLLAELEAEAADKSYDGHVARRAAIEAETGRPSAVAACAGLGDASF